MATQAIGAHVHLPSIVGRCDKEMPYIECNLKDADEKEEVWATLESPDNQPKVTIFSMKPIETTRRRAASLSLKRRSVVNLRVAQKAKGALEAEKIGAKAFVALLARRYDVLAVAAAFPMNSLDLSKVDTMTLTVGLARRIEVAAQEAFKVTSVIREQHIRVQLYDAMDRKMREDAMSSSVERILKPQTPDVGVDYTKEIHLSVFHPLNSKLSPFSKAQMKAYLEPVAFRYYEKVDPDEFVDKVKMRITRRVWSRMVPDLPTIVSTKEVWNAIVDEAHERRMQFQLPELVVGLGTHHPLVREIRDRERVEDFRMDYLLNWISQGPEFTAKLKTPESKKK